MSGRFRSLAYRVSAIFVLVAFISIVVVSPLAAQPGETEDNSCMQARLDGQRAAKGNPLWFLAGAGCGIFGAGAAYLVKPSPPMTALMGKPSEYVLCYTEAYQSKARNENTMWACGGWATFVAIYAAAGGFETDSSE